MHLYDLRDGWEEVEIDDEKFGLKLARVGLGFSASVRPIHSPRATSACRTLLLSDAWLR